MLKDWYFGIDIPDFKDDHIKDFVRSTLGIFVSTMNDEVKVRPTIQFSSDVEVACADQINSIIYFNDKIFSPDENERYFKGYDSSDTLAICMGISFHECLHFRYTYNNLEFAFKMLGLNPDNRLLFSVFNITEDHYIEHFGRFQFPNLVWTLTAAHSAMFTQEALDGFIAKVEGEPTTIEEVINILNVFTSLKNWRLKFNFDGIEILEQVYKLMMSAKEHEDCIERIQISNEIYELLIKNLTSEEQDKLEQMLAGNAEDDEAIKKLMELLEALESMIASLIKDGTPMEVDPTLNPLENVERKDTVDYKGSIISVVPDQQFFDLVKSEAYDERTVEPDKRYLELSDLINARTFKNHCVGQQRDRGRQMRQLYRIATDSKIFADPVELQTVGPQEIIFLLDASGSMGVRDKFFNACGAILGSIRGLELSRHNVAVFAHTAENRYVAEVMGHQTLLMFNIKEFGDSVEVAANRIRLLAKHTLMLSENNDDLAITEAASRFTEARNNKTLIVVSDGEPASSRLSRLGRLDGIDLTQKAVEAVRSRGINVLSVSIDASAYKANNRIYGINSNTCNTDANIVASIISQIFTNGG